MTANDTTYFLSNPVFGNADYYKYWNTFNFLKLNTYVKLSNYTDEEVENILLKAKPHEIPKQNSLI